MLIFGATMFINSQKKHHARCIESRTRYQPCISRPAYYQKKVATSFDQDKLIRDRVVLFLINVCIMEDGRCKRL